MGFIRRQEERMALQFLTWKYQKSNIELPPESVLQKQAGELVDESHRIARETGSNILSILKELADSYLKPKK